MNKRKPPKSARQAAASSANKVVFCDRLCRLQIIKRWVVVVKSVFLCVSAHLKTAATAATVTAKRNQPRLWPQRLLAAANLEVFFVAFGLDASPNTELEFCLRFVAAVPTIAAHLPVSEIQTTKICVAATQSSKLAFGGTSSSKKKKKKRTSFSPASLVLLLSIR